MKVRTLAAANTLLFLVWGTVWYVATGAETLRVAPERLDICPSSASSREAPIILSQVQKEAIMGAAAGCKDCTEEWVSQYEFFGDGNSECQHGPDADPDCIKSPTDPCYYKDCKQLNDPKCANPNCDCLECGDKPGCEELIEQWLAWCGWATSATAARNPCKTCKTENGTYGAYYRYKAQVLSGTNTSCQFNPNPADAYKCYSGSQIFLGCKTDDCEPTGSWTTRYGTRKKCKK